MSASSPRGIGRRGPPGTIPSAMSDHTEHLRDLTERIAHAKEFL
jgi:hypothetical protein